MVYKGLERREFIRVPLSITVRYSVVGASEEYKESQTENISTGGMKLRISEKLQVGTLLKLQFELLREEKIIKFDALEAKIVWVSPNPERRDYPYKAGIMFINLDLNDRIFISNCIYHRLDLYRKPFR